MKKQLSKLILKTCILTVALILSDRIIGTGLEYLFYQQTHGDDYTTLYALEQANEDILIFGTSRASHHYNARAIEATTGISCFNAGRDEMEIPYTEALLKIILKRHKPKVVLLDIGPIELGGDKVVESERIAATLMPFMNKYPSLESTIGMAGSMEVNKLKVSKTYAYNSKIGSAIQNSYTQLGHHTDKGYEPLYKTIDTAVYKESIWEDMNAQLEVNKNYEQTLLNIMTLAKENDIQLVLVISPFYFYNNFNNNPSYNTIKEIVQSNNVLLLDYTNSPLFTGNHQLFNDDVHLNDTGASVFTKEIISLLQHKAILQ